MLLVPPAVTATIQGETQMLFAVMQPLQAQIQAGKLRAIAVTSAQPKPGAGATCPKVLQHDLQNARLKAMRPALTTRQGRWAASIFSGGVGLPPGPGPVGPVGPGPVGPPRLASDQDACATRLKRRPA